MNWHALRTYGQTPAKSFEELCYQIAKTLFGSLGRFTPIDDSGGGDGVEFYLELPNGEEWGWQAKFYLPGARLSDSNRQAAISGSLRRALAVHPRLTKWYLCTPMTFTPRELSWLRGVDPAGNSVRGLPEVIPFGHGIEIEHWNESDFGDWLSQPRFAGKRQYFFGELELDAAWFARRLDQERPSVSHEYLADLHVKTDVDRMISLSLGGAETQRAVREALDRLQSALAKAQEHRNELADAELRAAHDRWRSHASAVQENLASGLALVEAGDFETLAPSDFERQSTAFGEALELLQQTLDPDGESADWVIRAEFLPTETVRREQLIIVRRLLDAAQMAQRTSRAASNALMRVQQSAIHLHGDAGQGKTHTVFDLCHRRVSAGQPAIFLSARGMRDGRALVEQLRTRLDVPPSYSWDDLLGALDSAAKAHRVRLPVVIDGLNESGPIGPNNIWAVDLPRLVVEFKAHPNLLLVTTCRSSYLPAIWPSGIPSNLSAVRGFGFKTDEAVKAYFTHYKLAGDMTGVPLRQFAHPIYLRMFCEVHNPDRAAPVDVFFGEEALYEVFEHYLNRVNTSLVTKLGRRPGSQVLRPLLDRVADELWNSGVRDVSLDAFMVLTDGSADADWADSKAKALLDEGLVASRNYVGNEERVGFTYDLLGGYLIARRLLAHHQADFRAFLTEGLTLQALLGVHGLPHPLGEDIGRCLAALCALELREHLHEVAGEDRYLAYALPMVFELPPLRIGEHEQQLVRAAFLRPAETAKLMDWASPVLLSERHPLNARFWSDVLMRLGVTERDLTWSEALRNDWSRLREMIEQLEEQADGYKAVVSEAHLDLMAEMVAWMQTTPDRSLRDLATRALHRYGRRRPAAFLDLVSRLLATNDPYVVERVLAAACAVALTYRVEPADTEWVRQYLPVLASTLYGALFAERAPQATTHILARDYARRVIRLASTRHPLLFPPEQLARALGPYPRDLWRDWGRSSDRDHGQYRDGDRPLGMDFENYTLGRLVDGRRNYDFSAPGHIQVREQVWWRIYDLGYRLEDFSSIDQAIANENSIRSSEDGHKTERYGKKYAWIAYHELAGLLFDDERTERDAHDYVDIDPSFPEAVRMRLFVLNNWLNTEEPNTQRWITGGGPPEAAPYLVRDELSGAPGPWVLLDGYVTQLDEDLGRERFTFMRSFLVAEDDFEAFMAHFTTQSFAGRWLPEKPEVHEWYAADLPPEVMFDHWGEMTFTTVTGTQPEMIAVRDGEPVLRDELLEIAIEVEAMAGEQSEINRHWTAMLAARRIEFIDGPDMVGLTQETRFNIVQPVVEGEWSAYKSAANPGWHVTVPAHALVEHLGLRQRLPGFDFEGIDGELASSSFEFGAGNNRHSFVYFRRNALEVFLEQRRMRLVWGLWGERTYSVDALTARNQYRSRDADQTQPPTYQAFQQVFVYETGGIAREIASAGDTTP